MPCPELWGGNETTWQNRRQIAQSATPQDVDAERRNAPKATGHGSSSLGGREKTVARLTRELRESLQRQTATADVLKVISRSTFDLQTVLDTLVKSAARLCEANYAFIFRREGNVYHLAASHGFAPDYRDWMAQQSIPVGRQTLVGRTAVDGRTVHIPDAANDPEYGWSESIKRGKFRTMLGVPLLREGVSVGVIAICRRSVQPFADKQIDLVTTFADQAVIAIENARLFEEVQARTRDLQEALTYQTGSSNILKVIASSPTDVEPVLKAIVENACELCDAYDSVVLLRDGDQLRISAHHGPIPISFGSLPINRNRQLDAHLSIAGRFMSTIFLPRATNFPSVRNCRDEWATAVF
jgi:two-component system, NtrC family, sensor kinase